MGNYCSREVPFILRGNRRCLTELQLQQSPELLEFVKRFRSSFEYDSRQQVFVFIEGL